MKVFVRRLKFSEPELEREFIEEYDRRSLFVIRVGLLVGLFLYSIFGLLDAFIIPDAKDIAWVIRFLIIDPLLVIVFALTFVQKAKKHLQPLLMIMVSLGGFGIIAMIASAASPGDHLYYAGLILVLIFGYVFIRMRFFYASIAGIAVLIAYEIVAIWVKRQPFYIVVNNNFFLVSTNLLCMIASYTMERSFRLSFLQEKQIKSDKEKLEELNEKFKQLSITDYLTGLYNRRFLDLMLWRFLLLYKRYRTPTSLLLIDLDRFKELNDSFGHDYGDNVLIRVSKIIKDTIRESDMAFRYGGDEFCVILPNTDLSSAVVVGNNLIEAVNAYAKEERIPLSLSVGCSCFKEGVDTPAELLRKTDELLYKVKEKGGGCLVYV